MKCGGSDTVNVMWCVEHIEDGYGGKDFPDPGTVQKTE